MSDKDHDEGCGCERCSEPVGPVRPDPIIDRLDPDMYDGEGLVVLRGYLAQDADAQVWRLYITLTLDEYFLIQNRDIVSQHQHEQPGAGSTVWVRGGAGLRLVRMVKAVDLRAASGSAEPGSFLTGSLARLRPSLVAPFPEVPGMAVWDAYSNALNWTRRSCCSPC